jgi:hypothetical protein
MPQFEIEVGGSIAPFVKNLNDLKARLKELQFDLSRATDPISIVNLNRELRQTEAEIKQIKDLGSIIPSNATNGLNSATLATTNFGRILQDIPYGFIGISNNLNPLLESFQRLRAETGSGKAALQALGSSLIGAGGLGLALSAVTALLSFSSIGLQAWGVKSAKAKDEADKLKEAIRDLNLVESEAAASTEGQIAQVQALANEVANTNLSYNERKRALQELQEINKSYFKDLEIEDAATGKLANTVNEYTNALINSAIQKEFVGEIAKIAKAVADQDAVIAASRSKLVQAQNEVDKAQERTKGSFTEEQISANAQVGAAAIEKLTEAQNNLSKENEKVTALLTQEALLRDRLNKAVEQGLKFRDLDAAGQTKQEDALKKRLEALERLKKSLTDVNDLANIQEAIFELQVKISIRDQGKNHLTDKELQQQIQGFQKELNQAFLNQALSLELSPKVAFSPVSTVEIPKAITNIISKATGNEKITITLHDVRVKFFGARQTFILEGKEKINDELSRQINDSLANLRIDLSTTLGESLGEAFATAIQGGDLADGLRKAAQQMLSILGSVMQQIGRYVIAAAIKIKLLKETLEKWAIANPALAILAGVGLIAAGAVLKNASFAGPKFASGGIVTGPTVGMIGEAGPEVIMPLNRLAGMIGGNKGTTVVLNGTLAVKGRDLVALITQETKRFNRLT